MLNSWQLNTSFLAAIAFFLGTGVIGYRAVDMLVENQRRQVAARLIAVELQNLLGLATQAETGQRGYVITGRDAYLAPYHDARRRMPHSIATLRGALRGNQLELQRLDEVERLQRLKFAELEETIRLRREHGLAAAQALVLSDRGRALMDAIRANVAIMEGVEGALLRQRLARFTRSAEQAYATLAVSALLNLGSILFLVLMVQRDHRMRQAEAARLRDARNLLDSMIDNSPSPIYLYDRDHRVVVANKALLALMGMPKERVIGRTPHEVLPAALADAQVARNRAALADSGVQVFEEAYALPGGVHYFLTSRVAVRGSGGELIGVCGVSSDITALKRAQDEIAALNRDLERRVADRTEELAGVNRALQDANGALEAFSYTVAHDLRAPLRGIQGFAEAVHEDYAAELDAAGRDYLLRIGRAAARMERLIEDLLSYSRLSRAELPLETVRLDEVLHEVLANLAVQTAESGARVEAAPLPAVTGNWSACVQVLQNLLSNALKFARPGTAPAVAVTAETAAGQARIAVADNGIGIAPHQLERIFLPFERLHGVQEYAGSGIGLAIVAKAVARMNGRCGVQSNTGAGSRFWFELPLAAGDAP